MKGSTEPKLTTRCAALGIALRHAQRLAAENSRTDPQSLLRVLGLDISTLVPLKPRRWLWMAAQTSSVSYRGTLTPEVVLTILTTGEVPDDFSAHVGHLLNEAPIPIVVMAVEQAAQQSGTPIHTIWRNVERIANEMQSQRKAAWAITE